MVKCCESYHFLWKVVCMNIFKHIKFCKKIKNKVIVVSDPTSYGLINLIINYDLIQSWIWIQLDRWSSLIIHEQKSGKLWKISRDRASLSCFRTRTNLQAKKVQKLHYTANHKKATQLIVYYSYGNAFFFLFFINYSCATILYYNCMGNPLHLILLYL